jgi:hypothetical protein
MYSNQLEDLTTTPSGVNKVMDLLAITPQATNESVKDAIVSWFPEASDTLVDNIAHRLCEHR